MVGFIFYFRIKEQEFKGKVGCNSCKKLQHILFLARHTQWLVLFIAQHKQFRKAFDKLLADKTFSNSFGASSDYVDSMHEGVCNV